MKKKTQKKAVKAKAKVKQIPCNHKFVIERGGFDEKTGEVSFLDMRCEKCGIPLFCSHPTTHTGDSANRLLKVTEI